jgi:two-component system nitrate/nitrite sensor histidine kinase NarX
MSRPRTLAAKLLSLGVALLLLAVISVGVTLWISLRLEGGAAAVNEAGRLRMQAWRLAAQVSAGESALVQDLGGQFELSLALLRDGDSRRPLAVPWDDTAQRRFDAVVTHWHQLKPVWLGTAPPLPAQASQRAVAIVTDIDAFVAAVEHALARWTAILSLAQMGLMVLAIGAALLLMLAGQALVLSPLARLGEGLARVEEGDLSTRVAVGTLDEFGQLAQGFNRMAQTLETLYGGLEHKVREKTAHLETQRQRLARHCASCTTRVDRTVRLHPPSRR